MKRRRSIKLGCVAKYMWLSKLGSSKKDEKVSATAFSSLCFCIRRGIAAGSAYLDALEADALELDALEADTLEALIRADRDGTTGPMLTGRYGDFNNEGTFVRRSDNWVGIGVSVRINHNAHFVI